MTSSDPNAVPDLSSFGFDPPADLPPAVRANTRGAAWMPLRLGGPRADRYELRWADGRVALLSTSPSAGTTAEHGEAAARVAATLADERDRLVWLGTHIPVPEVLEWSSNGDGVPFLLTTAPPGTPAAGAEHGGDAEALIAALADGVRRFHAIPVASCPFPMGLDHRLGDARGRVMAGAVVQDELSAAYRRYTPARLLELLVEGRPGEDDLVVVHGAAGLPTLHLEGGRVSGYVELAGAGVSDRYVDLATMAASLARFVSPEALGPFFDAYGIDLPDLRKIDFYVLLDELR